MSFSDTLRSSLGGAIPSARQLLHGGSLKSMAQAVGVIGGASLLAASYQLIYEEGRMLIQSIKGGFATRRDRNNAVMCTMLCTDLPLPIFQDLRKARNAFDRAIDMTLDTKIDEAERTKIRTALTNLVKKSL